MEKHAGWDFFVPNDLTLGDFFNNSAAFINEFVEAYTEDLPVRFLVNHNGEIRRYGFYAINNTSIGIKYYKYDGNVFKVDEISELLTMKVEEIVILPGGKILIPSGIHVNLPKNVFLNAENKSGIASKRGLLRGACVTGDTLIETNKGKFKASDLTKEFCENNNILIKSWNGLSKTYVYKKCDGFRITNEIECVKITFNDDSEICGSYDHCILTESGWKDLENL